MARRTGRSPTSRARARAQALSRAAAGHAAAGWLSRQDRRLRQRPLSISSATSTARLSHDIAYRVRMEPGVQTPDETLAGASGSCRDSGWLLVQILRRLGLAARFVSGYLIQLRPDVGAADDPARAVGGLHRSACVGRSLYSRRGLDRARSHLGPARRRGTHSAGGNALADQRSPHNGHARRRRRSISRSPCASSACARRRGSPSPTARSNGRVSSRRALPWRSRLKAGDVRLSMGGEPTFVALRDSEAPEWNIAALGPTKRAYADKLARRLCARFANGGLLHYGQGKWYPGEQAARWAFAIYWRGDGEPLWRDAELIAEETAERPATIADAETICRASCAARSVCRGDSAIPAYEDAAHFVLVEQKLPLGVAPEDNTLAEPAERERLMRVFDRGLDKPAGYVLPLLMTQTRSGRQRRFITERWAFRARTPVPDPRRFAHRPAAAAGGPARDQLRRLSARAARRSLCRPPQAAHAAQTLGNRATPVRINRRLPPKRRAGANGARRRGCATGTCACSCRRFGRAGLCRADRRHRGNRGQGAGSAIRLEGYAPPFDPRIKCHQGDARSWRHRGECAPRGVLEPRRRNYDDRLRRGCQDRAGCRKVQAGRPPSRHRRRQPHRPRRHDAGRQPVPAAAGPAGQHHRLLAEPPLTVLHVRWPVRRAHQPGAARRRGAARGAL